MHCMLQTIHAADYTCLFDVEANLYIRKILLLCLSLSQFLYSYMLHHGVPVKGADLLCEQLLTADRGKAILEDNSSLGKVINVWCFDSLVAIDSHLEPSIINEH